MKPAEAELLVAIELHDVDRMRAALDAGLDARVPVQDKSTVQWLTEMYTRSDRLPACLRLLLDRGAALDDPVLAPVLLDDDAALAAAIRRDAVLLDHRTQMASAFTPLAGASLLHVACEYGHAKAAHVLIEMGADVEARAAVDEFGLGGHTPLFHTVNSNDNRSEPVLRLLLDAGARVDIQLAGLRWGGGFEWETVFFDITPISYAQLGSLPQMHRDERDIQANVVRMLGAAKRRVPPARNVPNRYAQGGRGGRA